MLRTQVGGRNEIQVPAVLGYPAAHHDTQCKQGGYCAHGEHVTVNLLSHKLLTYFIQTCVKGFVILSICALFSPRKLGEMRRLL